ncbi:MAG: hypothetical protein GWO07_13205 [Candidatus Dadabacteria bacterium]|nr:hypothetical protein [Candidatus Dadabacteria bacterium]NIV40907.1 hypothetical protein [Candidatus Dadabacteria bacterium]NIX16157.1 hypothetical protein [Candidatus Dadabacteria bacterium]
MNNLKTFFTNLSADYKNIGILAIVIIFIILGSLLFYQNQRVKQYRSDLAKLDQQIDEKKAQITEQVNILEGQQKNLEHKFSDLTMIISDQIYSDQIGKDFFKFIEDPNGRKLYRDQQKIVINEIYEDLIADLYLNESEENELIGLLVDKQMVNLEIIVSLLKGDMTEAQIAENEKKFNEMIARADNNLRSFFEDDEFELFEEYNLTLHYRSWILEFKTYLADRQIFLDLDQEEDLLFLILNESEDFNFTERLQANEFNSGVVSEADLARINRYILEKEELDQIITDKSQSFLDERQLKALEDYLKLKRTMDEMGFEITKDIVPSPTPAN